MNSRTPPILRCTHHPGVASSNHSSAQVEGIFAVENAAGRPAALRRRRPVPKWVADVDGIIWIGDAAVVATCGGVRGAGLGCGGEDAEGEGEGEVGEAHVGELAVFLSSDWM